MSSGPWSASSSASSSSGARSSSTARRVTCRASGTTPRTSMLESEFMRLAPGAGAVVGVLAPAVGFFLVQRRQSLTGDGIGHVAFAGVAAGILLDVAPVLTALIAAILGASPSRLSAAGALNVDPFQSLFGSILTVTRSDLLLIAALGAVGLAIVGLLYRPLAGVVIDEEGARVAGGPVGAPHIVVAPLAA